MSCDMKFLTMWYVWPAKPLTRSLIRAYASCLNILLVLLATDWKAFGFFKA